MNATATAGKLQRCFSNDHLVKHDRGAVKDLLPQVDDEDVRDDKVDGAVGGEAGEAGPGPVGLDVSPLAVGRVH